VTFSRANGANWGVGDELTSAQMNIVDTNAAGAVDKSGDTLTGTINVGAAGKIVANNAASVIEATANGAKIRANGAGALIQTVSGGRIQLADSDWVTFSANRTRSITQTPAAVTLSSGWTYLSGRAAVLVGPASSTTILIPLTALHNGALLASVDMYFAIAGSHGAVPGVLPKFGVQRAFVSDGHLLSSPASLWSGGDYKSMPSPADVTAYEAGGLTQHFTLTCDQNHTIDRSQYTYAINVADENGANSIAGNLFCGFVLNYSTIADMRFS